MTSLRDLRSLLPVPGTAVPGFHIAPLCGSVRVMSLEWARNRKPNDLTWEVVVFVIRDGNRYAVNDVYYPKVYADDSVPHYPTVEDIRLSELLRIGCKDGKWVGYPEK